MRFDADELIELLGLRLARDTTGRLGVHLAARLRGGIRSVRLPAGTVMPPSRSVAAALGVSRGVVVAAYDQLIAEGYLVARQGSGTRVSETLAGPPETPPPSPAPPAARPGVPDLGMFPRARWLNAYRHAVQTASTADLGYGDPRGHLRLRTELAGYLRRTRSADTDPERLIITGGVAEGLVHLADALRAAGHRRVAVEDPTSPGTRALLTQRGLDVVAAPVDREGVRVDELPVDIGAVLLTPAHQYPTGWVLSPRRRRAVIEQARRHGFLVIEDDYDGAFRYQRDPVGCLQGLAPDVTALLGSVSKTLAPGLRLGWMLLPPRLHRTVLAHRTATNQTGQVLDQLAFTGLVSSGGYDKHVRAARRVYHARRRQLVAELLAALPEVHIHGDDSGLHVLIELPPSARETDVVAALRRRGFDVQGHAECAVAPGPPPAAGLVVGFAALPPPAISSLVEVLAGALTPARDDRPRDSNAVPGRPRGRPAA